MEVITNLLSKNIDYINALRHAQPLPQNNPTPIINTIEPKKSNFGWPFFIITIGVLGILAMRNYLEKEENKSKK